QNTKPVVAITGSNGKSTVVSLLASVLNSVSVKAIAAGNIGLPALEVINNDIDVFVLELSSFQLERMTTCPSSVACMLNLSEDHMDRYDSMDDYAQAKHIIYKGALSTVFNISEVLTQASSDAPSFSFGKLSAQADFSYDSANGGIYYQNECLLNAGDLTIKGSHNIENVLAVLAILKQLIQQSVISCSLKDCLAAIKTFSGLSHRSQFVATVDHVDYIDDSKATNVGASLAALLGLQSSYSEIIILIGGVDKASDFSKLINYIANHQVRAVIYGQDAPVIQSAFDLESVPYSNAKTMLQALDVAIKCAAHKSAILLAPACASFDEFKNFSERGDAFINAVKRLAINEGACS
ncbi:MAG: UDP-N-acetylmuramoyl-L-alanine--D-glutamate ligase, partial [Sinobacterium sp.]|nr:UDP-N-acetylmuramoyl-L-alanine--D-glutamate ligase [Sinobacterium sp.]